MTQLKGVSWRVRRALPFGNGTFDVAITYVHEAIVDPDIRSLVTRYIVEEAVPTLEPIAGTDLVQWGLTVMERFGNPQIQDPLARICEQASIRLPKFILPVVADRLARGGTVAVCAAVIASWARHCEGRDEAGRPITIMDPSKDALMAAAGRQHSRPTSFIENAAVFGDLGQSPEFSQAFVEALSTIRAQGARALVRQLAAQA